MADSNTPARRSRGASSAIEGTPPARRTRKRSGSNTKSDSTTTISAADRLRMIETAAYYRAERRGFVSGHEADDWLFAETEIDALIAAAQAPANGAAVKRTGARKT